MAGLTREAELIQNPGLVAALLWRFACGYSPKDAESVSVPLHLTFVVSPVVLNSRRFSVLASTRQSSGLRGYVSKFESSAAAREDLLALPAQILLMRELTMRGLRIALTARLLILETETASLIPATYTNVRAIPKELASLLKGAEKLGAWLSSLTTYEVQKILGFAL